MARGITAYQAKPTYEEWTEACLTEAMQALDHIIEKYRGADIQTVRIGKPFDIEVTFRPKK